MINNMNRIASYSVLSLSIAMMCITAATADNAKDALINIKKVMVMY